MPRLVTVEPEARHELYTLVDAYLAELATHRERPVGPTDAASYRYLPLYWREAGRHPLFIDTPRGRAGFALVRELVAEGVVQMSDFFIRPEQRRSGLGTAAVEAIWRRFPGSWELQVHPRNEAASEFWSRCIDRFASGPVRVAEVVEDDGRRTQYQFEIAPA